MTLDLQDNGSHDLCRNKTKEEIGSISLSESKRVTEDGIEEGLIDTESKAKNGSADKKEY